MVLLYLERQTLDGKEGEDAAQNQLHADKYRVRTGNYVFSDVRRKVEIQEGKVKGGSRSFILNTAVHT